MTTLACGCNHLAGRYCPEALALFAKAQEARGIAIGVASLGYSIFSTQEGIDADHTAVVAWIDYRAHLDPEEEPIEIRKRVLL